MSQLFGSGGFHGSQVVVLPQFGVFSSTLWVLMKFSLSINIFFHYLNSFCIAILFRFSKTQLEHFLTLMSEKY